MTNKQKREIVEILNSTRKVADVSQAEKEYNKKLDDLIFAVNSSSQWVSKIPMW